MKRFLTNILIRNKRLDMMQGNGLDVSYEILSDDDYAVELRKKIVEEANELLDAKDIDDVKNEIVDVLEVVEHLAMVYGINSEELEILKQKKQEKFGSFDKKIKTHYVQMPDDHEEIEYYMSKPCKYPLVKDGICDKVRE